MNRAARKYLHQVKKRLYSPNSLRKEFLRQLEDEVLLFCEQEKADYSRLTEQFGQPEEIAADFFTEVDPKAVSRFAYTRLKLTYGILAAVLVLSLSGVAVKLYDYVQTRQLVSSAPEGVSCSFHGLVNWDHPTTNCTVFWVRTCRKGEDQYWEYHSCNNRFYHTIPPEGADGSEPYAEDIYVSVNGETTHWHFGEEHTGWYKVYDDM